MRFRELAIAGVLLITSACTALGAEPPKAAGGTPIVIHLSKCSDNLHATLMALKLARAVQERHVPVVLFLDLEGVRLADRRQPQTLRWGTSEPISSSFDAFIKAGGKTLVCPHCANATGLDGTNLRESTQIATEDELSEMIINAAKIMDY